MFIGPAGYNMDHDDGSSEFHDDSNIVYTGGYKLRDGVNRNATRNLMIDASPQFQVAGFPTDFYQANTHVGFDGPLCGPTDIGGLSGNIFLTIANDSGISGTGATEAHSRALRCDAGTTRSVTLAQLYQLAKQTIQLQ